MCPENVISNSHERLTWLNTILDFKYTLSIPDSFVDFGDPQAGYKFWMSMKLFKNGKVGFSNLSSLGYRYSQLNIKREHSHHYGCSFRILLFYFFVPHPFPSGFSIFMTVKRYSANHFMIITSLREIIFICFKQIISMW